mmetsp:Transcript_108250/g.208017  ORF Transcript_108250/g.208017 Transcript_108250/m.208017 type:complete len:360 (+) Transcript_108250:46-1125(+)
MVSILQQPTKSRLALMTGTVLSIAALPGSGAAGDAPHPLSCSEKSRAESDSASGRRVLVTGASGLLGRQVMRVFDEKAWSVRGLAFSRTSGPLVKCDIFNHSALAEQFEEFRPSIVIHCAAERRPDILEKNQEYATKINVEAARTIAELSHTYGAWLIYLSTNYVFDGKDAPYAEDAQPNPVNVYGVSKFLGEQEVAKVHNGAAILRVPLLYGPLEYLQETSLTTLLETIRKPGVVKLDNWQERFPTNAEDLAEVLQAMASTYAAQSAEAAAFSGVFHWQANERHTKYTMGIIIAEIAGLDHSQFIPVDTAPPVDAKRPQFERMLCTRLERLLGVASGSNSFRSDFRSSLQQYLKPFVG